MKYLFCIFNFQSGADPALPFVSKGQNHQKNLLNSNLSSDAIYQVFDLNTASPWVNMHVGTINKAMLIGHLLKLAKNKNLEYCFRQYRQ